MGSDPIFYHGMGRDLVGESLNTKFSGNTSGTSIPGISATDRPATADFYATMASSRNSVPQPTSHRDLISYEDSLRNAHLEALQSMQQGRWSPFLEGARTLPLAGRKDKALQFEVLPHHGSKEVGATLSHAYDDLGYDLALIQKKDTIVPDINQEIVFQFKDPSQLRSKFAAFDPSRRNESDLLAGMVPAGFMRAVSTGDNEAHSTRLHVTP